ncbi:MAG: NADH-quinone oxidoreductase subunit F, partial [Clostridiales bacterium]
MKIVIGEGSCGLAAGAGKVHEKINEVLSSNNLKADVEITGCCGMCYLEPIVDIYDDFGEKTTYVKVTPEMVDDLILKKIRDNQEVNTCEISQSDINILGNQKRIVLRNCGIINPEKIDDYLEAGGYEAIKKCISQLTPEDVIDIIKKSGLRGRGGAGFPTWFKWNAARASKSEP